MVINSRPLKRQVVDIHNRSLKVSGTGNKQSINKVGGVGGVSGFQNDSGKTSTGIHWLFESAVITIHELSG